MAQFTVDGGRIHYVERGRGDPPLVFVHGLACGLEDWRDQVSRFAPHRRVICLDQRGHGRSAGHASGFDIPTFAADVAALAAELHLPPAVLVGHSFGCRVVLECARAFSEIVAGLVLIDGSRLSAETADQARHATRIAIQDSGYAAFMQRLFEQMFTRDSDPAVRDAIIARAKRLPPEAGLELVPAMVAWDAGFVEDALAKVNVPMKVLQSTWLNEDRERVSIPPDGTTPWLELAKERVPGAQIDIVPGVGHFSMIEAADVVNDHIEALLQSLEHPPSA